MTDTMDLEGPRFGPVAGEAKELVILLHGLGADGNDLIGLAPHFAQALPGAAFVSPHAPFVCDMAPMGRQWFSLQSRDPASVLEGVQAVSGHLNAFIDKELADHGLSEDRLVLIGFSQGTMMAFHVAFRRTKPAAALIGFSGMLAGGDRLAGELTCRPPVLLVHGEADQVVAFGSMAAAQETLTAAGVEVTALARPGLGHGIDQEGISAAIAMLAARLA